MKVFLDDHILNRVHGRFEQRRIGGVRVMDIDLTIRNAVNAAESVGKIPRRGIEVRIGAIEIGEVFGYRRNMKLPLEEIDLVQEENDWLSLEPLAIHQGLKEHHRLVHLVLWIC